ncbi:uncharacterized protein LOC144325308 [Podarcis muralis]
MSVVFLCSDPSFPKPVLSLEPMEEITIGQRVTMRCGTQGEVKRFYLLKDNFQDWSIHSDMNMFTISDVSNKDAGRYSCSYTSVRQPYLLSEPSNPVELLLTDPQLLRPTISISPTRPLKLERELLKEAASSLSSNCLPPFSSDDASMNQISNYAQINQSLVVSGILVVLVFLLLSAGAFFWFKGKSNCTYVLLLPKHDAPTETEDIIYADLKREAPHTQEEAKSYDGSEDLVYAVVFQHNSKGVQAPMEDE